MIHTPRLTGTSRRKRSDISGTLDNNASEEEYRVGPGRPPKQYQFKPGQSGNPKGARGRKTRPITPDLKALLERALSDTVTLRQGEKDRIVTKAAAGIEQLVNQYAKGDRHARRDLIDLANKLGVDLVAGQGKKIEEAMQADVTATDKALLADYVKRHEASSIIAVISIPPSSRNKLKKPRPHQYVVHLRATVHRVSLNRSNRNKGVTCQLTETSLMRCTDSASVRSSVPPS